jgi:acyl-coenzyme A thioesterase 13
MNSSTALSGVPQGFEPIHLPDDFIEMVGPFLAKPEVDGLRLGMILEQRHGNKLGVAHGGCLVTLIDMVMGVGSGFATGIMWPHPTITLNCDFVRAAHLGNWIEGKARVTRRTQNFCFCSCDLVSNGEIVLAASGVFKVPDLERIPESQRQHAQRLMVELKQRA